jgi:Holliday junction DNA helicase RuvA
MISRISGELVSKSPTEVLIDVHGVGFTLNIPLSTFEHLGKAGTKATLFTHLHVREDALLLFGFVTEEERDIFRTLLSVNGIGPKMAQSILSGISTTELKQHIASGNSAALTAVPGIGRKTAERLIMELRDSLGRIGTTASTARAGQGTSNIRNEALLALTSLGYSRVNAERAIRSALEESKEADASVESLVKSSLRFVSSEHR